MQCDTKKKTTRGLIWASFEIRHAVGGWWNWCRRWHPAAAVQRQVYVQDNDCNKIESRYYLAFVLCRGEWGTFCHFFQNCLWCTHFRQLVFHNLLVYSLQQELYMSHWCFGCISIGFDVRVGYVSMRHLTEPAPYTGQVLSPAGAHSVSDGTHPFITARHPVPWNVSFQFVPLILVNYNIP